MPVTIRRANYQLTEKEEKFYKRHKKLCDAIVRAYDTMVHGGARERNDNFKSALLTLEDSLGKELIQKLVAKKFWEGCEQAKKEVEKWPEWKRRAAEEILAMPEREYDD